MKKGTKLVLNRMATEILELRITDKTIKKDVNKKLQEIQIYLAKIK